ncbi:MAG: dipeptide epimerase [Ktedonobacterales bacterium]|nr:dipeptide epimerase [Ktedonobacterales bacterium]
MSTPTSITSVTVEPLNLPLYEPFQIATGVFPAANNVIVRVTLASGAVGLGEASPSLPSGGETQATVLAGAQAMAEVLPERDAASWRGLAQWLRANFKAQECARAATEMALLDALTRHHGVPLYQWFGGTQTRIETDLTIPIVAPERARELASAIAARGIRIIKVKVGGDLGDDEARVVAIHEAAPAATLQLDGNQGFSVTSALRFLARLEARGIIPTLFEQPLYRDDWLGMTDLTARAPVAICADESVHTAADAIRVVRERAAHIINIKLMKSAFLASLDIVGVCHAARLDLMIGGMMESRLGSAAAAHFAAGIGGFVSIDLDTPMLIDGDPFTGGYAQTGGVYDLAGVTAGHGVAQR